MCVVARSVQVVYLSGLINSSVLLIHVLLAGNYCKGEFVHLNIVFDIFLSRTKYTFASVCTLSSISKCENGVQTCMN